MKTQIITYKDIAMQKNVSSGMEKAALKARARNTCLDHSNPALILEDWRPDDEHTAIHWKISGTALGEVIVASTNKGVCFLGFTTQDRGAALADLTRRFPHNPVSEKGSHWQEEAIQWMNNPDQESPVHLHLRGTKFQLSIWRKLMTIPFGGLTTYMNLGGNANNARATGAAVGANPVSFILACHRVVRSDGSYDGYHWGNDVKRNLLSYEEAITSGNKN